MKRLGRDALLVTGRHLGHLHNRPGELVGDLVIPAILVVLFGYVLGSAITTPGADYRSYLMSGMFALTATTGAIATMNGVARDLGRGVMDRFRSLPMARSAVLLGRTGADLLTGGLGLIGMVVCGLAVGWRASAGPAPALAGFALLVLFRYALSWVGVFLGLLVSEELADGLVPIVFPLTMVSNAFVPTAGMPAWLAVIADWNPVSAVVAACRQLFGTVAGDPALGAPWPVQHPIVAALGWSAALLAVFGVLSVRRFRRAGR